MKSEERCRTVQEVAVLNLEPGTRDGFELTLKALGEQRPGMLPGDVVVKLKTRTHAKFQRKVNALIHKVSLSLKEALLGFERTITHLDGHTVELKVDGPIAVGATIEIDGEGMPHPKDPTERGPLVIKLEHEMPKTLSEKQQVAIRELF